MLEIIDALQLGYKVIANSMYGATGTGDKGYLPDVDIAATVTRIGRGMILKVKELMIKYFNSNANPDCPFDSDVIGGDTDSAFNR